MAATGGDASSSSASTAPTSAAHSASAAISFIGVTTVALVVASSAAELSPGVDAGMAGIAGDADTPVEDWPSGVDGGDGDDAGGDAFGSEIAGEEETSGGEVAESAASPLGKASDCAQGKEEKRGKDGRREVRAEPRLHQTPPPP